MDSGQAKNKDLATGSDDGFEASIMDICHSSLNDIYSTANSDMLIESLLKLQPHLQNLEERDERRGTGSKKNRDEYGVLDQKIRRFHIGIPKLKEGNETPQNMRISESIDVFKNENIKIEAELQDEIRKDQKIQTAVKELQKMLVNLEKENKALKTELQRPLKNSDGAKWLACDMENNECSEASMADKMKCKSSEQHEQNPVVSRQNERNIEEECNNVQEELLLQEGRSSLRTEASCEQQGMKSSRDGSSNLLMENEDFSNNNSRRSDSMQEQITLLQQELQAKTELVEIQKKQIGDLLQALVKGNCENARLTSEHNRRMGEQGDGNSLQAELVRAQQEKQKLQKELSAKLTDLKNLHIMFSSLGREKEIMAAELVQKTRILSDMEEDLNNLKEQNKTLSIKLESYAKENKTKNRDIQETIASLQDRNKQLAEQVLKISEGYRSLKRKSKDLQEQNSGFKKEIANLKVSILKQEKTTRVLESEGAALMDEISWAKRQLHFLLKNCQCFQKDLESLSEQQLTKPDSQKSLQQEIVFLEQFLLHFKEEIVSIKAESDRGVKEHKKLQEEMAMLRKELLCLRTENGVFIQGKKLNENRDHSIKRLEDTTDVLLRKRESLQAEVADISMEKSKLKIDDAMDARNQLQLNKMCIPQKQDDAVFSLKMAPGSEVRPPMNQTMKFHVVDDLQKPKSFSSEALLIHDENAQALVWTADMGGRFGYGGEQWGLSV